MLVSFFVMAEPSPSEIVVPLGFLVLVATGLRFPRRALPVLWLLAGLAIGGVFSALPVLDRERVATFVTISIFLAGYGLFFLVLLSENTQRRFDMLRRAWVLGALAAALAGIAGYFNVGGTRDLFTLYASRAKGTFNDPNVFGPYLIPPLLFLAQRLLTGTARRPLADALVALVLTVALFLSFSRAAWFHAVLSLAVFVFLTVATTRSTWLRTRVTLALLVGVFLVVAGLAALASVPEVRDILLQRASFNQEYDLRAGGRFDNWVRALLIILESPNGMGPLQFGRLYGEDPHNAYIHTFIAYGWAGGLSYAALVATTMWIGWRAVWRPTALQPALIVTVASFTGLVAIGFVIHSDHWRHFYLVVAMVWALALASDTAPRRG